MVEEVVAAGPEDPDAAFGTFLASVAVYNTVFSKP
jgi:hypothetical protein